MRGAMTYYQDKLEEGQAFERFVGEELARYGIVLRPYRTFREQVEFGENELGLEIKRDGEVHRTGNLWVEIEEKTYPTDPEWITSGIYRPDNSRWYGIGDEQQFYVFTKPTLQGLHRLGLYTVRLNHRRTSRGFLMPVADAAAWCKRRFLMQPDGHWGRFGNTGEVTDHQDGGQ